MNTAVKKFSGYKQALVVDIMPFLVGACYSALSPLMPIVREQLGCTYSEVGMPSTVETVTCFIAGLFAGQFIIKFSA